MRQFFGSGGGVFLPRGGDLRGDLLLAPAPPQRGIHPDLPAVAAAGLHRPGPRVLPARQRLTGRGAHVHDCSHTTKHIIHDTLNLLFFFVNENREALSFSATMMRRVCVCGPA